MADRNEIFRIILEGRDKLSGQLKGVREEVNKLDQALTKLKKNKTDDFPLFGGGKATRGPGGQFIRKEELTVLDQARRKVDDLNKSIQTLRRGRIKEGEFPLFGGGRAVRGEDGRFIRVQDVTLLEKAKNRLDAIDKTLIRIRTRIRRGPLVEGEEAGAGATRLVRNQLGQFVRASDITVVQRLGRELRVIGNVVKDIKTDTRGGILSGIDGTINDVRRLGRFIDDVGDRIRVKLLGRDTTRTGVDPVTNRFISVSNLTAFGRVVKQFGDMADRIQEKNREVAQSQRETISSFAKAFSGGLDQARQTEKLIEEVVAKTKEEFKERREAISQREAFLRVALTAQQQKERTELRRRLNVQREADEEEIENLRDHIRTLTNTEDDLEEKRAAKREIRRIRFERKERERLAQESLTAEFQATRADIKVSANEARRQLDRPDLKAVQEEAKKARAEYLATGTTIERMGKRAGLAFGDIIRGARAARSGMTDLDRDTNLVRNSFTRFGFAVGSLFKNFNQLVNLRWLFLTGILTIFLTLVVQIGTALVALAASAIQAGAALGGAFLAGVAQAAPAVGLLAAALSRFNTVLDLVKKNEQLDDKSIDADSIKNAAQRVADAQYNLKQAIQAVADAQYNLREANYDLTQSYKQVKDATKELADAKIQAARDIVDANLEEKDAALSLKEAELGVLEAKKKLREEESKKRTGQSDLDGARAALREAQERLKIAKAQGDQSEISAAQQQVTLAEQNLNAIADKAKDTENDLKQAQLDAKRADLTLEQARVRDKRAKEDAAKARREGVSGSEIVKNAQDQLKDALKGVADAQHQVAVANRGISDSLHQVAVAQREAADARKDHTDAVKGDSQATRDAAKAFADLSPAEKQLYNALKRIRKTFKDVFVGTNKRDGILGPITSAIAGVINDITNLLTDPKIQQAARDLSKALGEAITELGKLLKDPGFKEDLIFFIQNSIQNIPKVVKGLTDLFHIFLDIARSATPIFNDLLDKFVGVIDKVRGLTSQRGEVRRPEEGAVGRQGAVATINESGLDKFLAGAEKHLDAWLKLSGAILHLIFAITNSGAATSGKTLIERLTDALDHWADWIETHGPEVSEFFDKNVESITNLAKVLGRLGKALVIAFSSDEFEAFVQLMAEVIIPGLLLLIGALGLVSKALIALFKVPVLGPVLKWALAFLVFEKGLNKLFPVTQKITEAFKKLSIALFNTLRVLGLRGTLEYLRLSLIELTKKVYATIASLIRLGWAAGTAALRGLGRLAGFIFGPVIKAIGALRLSVRSLALSTGIGALILAGVLLIENWDKVKKYAKILAEFLVKTFGGIVDWVKENWKKILVGLLLAPFLPAGLIILGILKFKGKILGIFSDIKDGIINRFKAAFKWVREKLSDLTGFIGKTLAKIPGLGRFFKSDNKDEEPKPIVIELKPADKTKAEAIPTKRASGGVIPGHGVLDSVPALLTPGEWVLNKAQQERLAAVLGVTTQQIRATLFGTNSPVRPRSSSPQAIRGAKQATLARNARNKINLGSSPQAIQGMKQSRKVIAYSDFNLVSQEDDDGNTVWFLELANGSFGQVTARDAEKIQNTHGTWIPGYVKRSVGGFMQNIKQIAVPKSAFSLGGIVTSPGVRRFAEGGVVQTPGFSGDQAAGAKTINQNFSVKTSGETDWGYVLKLAAINAQETF